MLKQSFSRMKKILAILLAVLFVISLTFGAASACNSHGHHHIVHSGSSCGNSNCYTCGHGNCCNGISCHKCSCKGENICESDY